MPRAIIEADLADDVLDLAACEAISTRRGMSERETRRSAQPDRRSEARRRQGPKSALVAADDYLGSATACASSAAST